MSNYSALEAINIYEYKRPCMNIVSQSMDDATSPLAHESQASPFPYRHANWRALCEGPGMVHGPEMGIGTRESNIVQQVPLQHESGDEGLK